MITVPSILHTKAGLIGLLALVFIVNVVETRMETRINADCHFCVELGEKVAAAAQALEGGLSFRHHDNTNRVAVYGFSASYFFVLPLLLIGLAVVLAKRDSIEPFRVFAVAIALNYWISLPFFLLFPLPERWAYPESEAILLSDVLSEWLIRTIRPISGLDNSFPSFHVSLSIVAIGVSYIYALRFRRSILALGLTIILSTFVLGIHWLPDIVAGLALGVLSVSLAVRLNSRLAGRNDGYDGSNDWVDDAHPQPPTPVKDIFLSYHSGDIDRAWPIVESLENSGRTLWWDRKIKAGEPYTEKIEKELENSRCVVVLWSKGSVESHWVRDECSYAENQRKSLIPIFLDDVAAPLGFGQLNGIKLIGWDSSTDDHEFKRLLESLIHVLGVAGSTPCSKTVGDMGKGTVEKKPILNLDDLDVEQSDTSSNNKVSTVRK